MIRQPPMTFPMLATVTIRFSASVSLVALTLAVGMPAARGDDLPAPEPAAFAFKGAGLCVKCHRSEQGEWCDTATTAIWRHDAHARSHLALLSDNPRTAAMEQTLGIKAAATASCIACHTHSPAEPAVDEETEVVHAGISCETCHGAGGGYFEPHMEKGWRYLPAAEKAALGMHDLRDPVRKAENCLSCHLGDVTSGRVISHAMYAAGHPPLPAFEMETFSRAMGPHWKRVWEKSPKVQAAAAAAGYRTEAASETHRALVGALVALRRSATLVQDFAREAAEPGDGPTAAWPELALYDCQSCHHDLRIPSARQAAGYGALVPGRPTFVRWPRAAAGVALAVAGQPDDVEGLISPWVAMLNRQPFGLSAELEPGSPASLARIDDAIREIVSVPRDEALDERRREIAERLAAAGMRCGDFESARLVAWIMLGAMDGNAAWPADARDRVAANLAHRAAIGLPPPPEAAAGRTPFWRESLEAAGETEVDGLRAAFELPPSIRPPAQGSGR
jgi:hypothetical protein